MFSCKYWEISQKTCFEEHLRTPASEETLWSDWLGLSFWRVAFKNIQTKQYYKNTIRFQTRILFKFNPYALFQTQVSYIHHYRLRQKSKRLKSLDFLFV